MMENASNVGKSLTVVSMVALLQICGGMFVLMDEADESAATTYSGTDGNITWSINTDYGYLNLSGSGQMNNYTTSTRPSWEAYSGYIFDRVNIYSGITTIGDYAFYNITWPAKIYVYGSTLTSIGSCAFYDSSLQFNGYTIPSSVTTIGANAFERYGATNLTINDTVTTIGYEAFYNSSLTVLTISGENYNTVTFGASAFERCTSLIQIKCLYYSGLWVFSSNTWSLGYSGDTVTCTVYSPSNGASGNFDSFSNNYTTFNYVQSSWSVTIESNNTDYGTVSSSQLTVSPGASYSINSNVLTIGSNTVTATQTTSTAQYTYAFAGWSVSSGTVTSDMTITATFTRTLNQYTVTIEPNNIGYGSVSPASFTVDYGTAYSTSGNVLTVGSSTSTATATAATSDYYYVFSSWSSSSGTVMGDVTITANFTRSTSIIVTVESNNTDYGTVSPSEIYVPSGYTYYVADARLLFSDGQYSIATQTESTAQYTYSFDSWSSSSGTITENMTITAYFTRSLTQYTVTILSNNSNYGTVSPTSFTVGYGTSYSVDGRTLTVGSYTSTATPAAATDQYSYSFIGWSKESGTITGNTTIMAKFAATPLATTQSLTFDNIIGWQSDYMFGGSTTLAGLALLIMAWALMLLLLIKAGQPPAYSVVPMIPMQILFSGYGILNEVISVLIVLVAAVMISAQLKRVVD